MSYESQYGGCTLAFACKEKVAMVTDKYLGVINMGSLASLGQSPYNKVIALTSKVLCCVTGLVGDAQTVIEELRTFVTTYKIQHSREPSQDVLAKYFSRHYYEKGISRSGTVYYVSILFTGFDKNDTPNCAQIDFPFVLGHSKANSTGGAEEELAGVVRLLSELDAPDDEKINIGCQWFADCMNAKPYCGGGGACVVLSKDGKLEGYEFTTKID